MGAVIRNGLVPEHELAMSTIIGHNIPVVEADETAALQYLRRGDFKLESSQQGWALIAYRNLPLGWVKILPNRTNNYYPATWRIVNK